VLKAKLEEADLRLSEIKKEEYEFERDIVKGAANPRTGKANAEKVSKYLEDKLRAKVGTDSFLTIRSDIKPRL